MNLLYIVLPSAVVLTVAYLTYGRLLGRLLQLDPKTKTPAVELRDGIDFEPPTMVIAEAATDEAAAPAAERPPSLRPEAADKLLSVAARLREAQGIAAPPPAATLDVSSAPASSESL